MWRLIKCRNVAADDGGQPTGTTSKWGVSLRQGYKNTRVLTQSKWAFLEAARITGVPHLRLSPCRQDASSVFLRVCIAIGAEAHIVCETDDHGKPFVTVGVWYEGQPGADEAASAATERGTPSPLKPTRDEPAHTQRHLFAVFGLEGAAESVSEQDHTLLLRRGYCWLRLVPEWLRGTLCTGWTHEQLVECVNSATEVKTHSSCTLWPTLVVAGSGSSRTHVWTVNARFTSPPHRAKGVWCVPNPVPANSRRVFLDPGPAANR